jgi:hypothetical protein
VLVPEIGQGFLRYHVHGRIIAFRDISASDPTSNRVWAQCLSLKTERWIPRFGRIFHTPDDLVTNGTTPIDVNGFRAIFII